MLQCMIRVAASWIGILCLTTSSAQAAGGTMIVASKGQPVSASAAWPEGVEALVNDRCRTDGWNSWFTEWPNDVNQYGFEVESTADVNRLIGKLAEVQSDLLQVHLSFLKEPRGLGWVTNLPEGNNIAAVFSIGDQSRIAQWYARVRKPFGVMEFLAAPVAVPPTLTIFVGHDAVNLDELEIPAGIAAKNSYVPMVFHRANTKQEKQQIEEAASKPKPTTSPPKDGLEPAAQAAFDRIESFLKNRAATDDQTE